MAAILIGFILLPSPGVASESTHDAPLLAREWTVVRISLDGHILSEALVVLRNVSSDEIFLPLGQMADLVEFPIAVTTAPAAARGWFLSPQRIVDIDFEGQRAEVNGQASELSEHHWLEEPDDIYVSTTYLEALFPLEFSFNLRRLEVDITALEPLPVHRRLIRQERLARQRRFELRQGPTFDVVEAPYQMLGIPVFDVHLESSFRQAARESGSSSPASGGNYSVQGAGDLLWMTGRWSVAGSDSDPLRTMRFRLERSDPNAGLLGPLQATSVEVGDIQSLASPLVERGHSGRGLMISTMPLERPDHFDSTAVRGDLEPGWEVELYRNGLFLAVTETDAQGRYEFGEVPLVFGWNELKLVFFGPYGEEREERRNYLIGPGMIRAGQGQWRAVVQQQDRGTLPWAGLPEGRGGEGQLRASAQYDYGLSQNTAVVARATTMELRDGERRFYGSAGLRFAWKHLYAGFEAVGDMANGMGGLAHFHTRLGSVNIAGEHQQVWQGFGSERYGRPTTNRIGQSRLRIDGRVPFVDAVPYSLLLHTDYLADGAHRATLQGRYSFRIRRVRIHHTQRVRGDLDGVNTLDGILSARLRLRYVTPQAELCYDVLPELNLRRLRGGLGWRPMRTLLIDVGLNAEVEGGAIENFGTHLRLASRLDSLNWNVELGWEERLGYSAMVGVRMGVGINPHSGRWEVSGANLTSTGAVVSRVFWDHNGTGTFDDGDEPIEGASFFVDRSRRRAHRTTDDGGLYLAGLRPARHLDLSVDTGSLQDPFALSAVPGHSVISRPGTPVFVDFPVVRAGEIDGTVFVDGGARHREFPGACVRVISLRTGQVEKEVTAAFDGFYYVPEMPPGRYRVELCAEALERRGLPVPEARYAEIGLDGTIVAGLDFVVESAAPGSPD